MNTRSVSGTVFSGLAVSLLMILSPQAAHAQESLQWLYEGRPLDKWIAALEADDPSQRSDAVKAVATFRADQPQRVEPLLLEMLEEDPSHVVRRAAARAWVSAETTVDVPDAVVAALQSRLLDSHEHSSVRGAAATALGNSLVPGARALADAIDQIDDEEVRRAAIEQLTSMPNDIADELDGLPGLRAIIQETEDQPPRSSFTERIAWLRRLLQQHEDRRVHAEALARVQAAREIADLTVEKLVEIVNQQGADADAMALRALWSWSIHPKVSEAVAVLSDIVQTDDDHQRLWAAAALAIAPDSEGGEPAVDPFVDFVVQQIKHGKMHPEGISIILQFTAVRMNRPNEIFRGILSELEGDQADLVQRVWADVLGESGSEEPVLMSALLKDDDPRVRLEAAQQVKRNGWDDPRIVSALAEIVRNPNEQRYVIQAALEALVEIDPEAEKVPPLDDETLIRLIQEGRSHRRHPSLRKRLREGGEALVDKLIDALDEPAEQVRQQEIQSASSSSARVLDALATVGEPAIPALRRLTIEHAVERKEFEAASYLGGAPKAAYALAQIEPQGMETLVELSRHDEPAVRREAVSALPAARRASEEDTPDEIIVALVAAANDDIATVRGPALQSIGRLQESDARLFAVVVDNLEHENVEIARQAVRTLQGFAQQRPQQVVRAYAEALRRDRWKVRWEILASLKRMGPLAEAALPEIQALVGHEDLRNRPLQTIAAMGPAAEQAKDLLLDRLGSPDESQSFWAAVALTQFDTGVKPALPVLIEQLRSESQTQDRGEALRVVAAEALGEIGPRAEAAAEPLLELVRRELQKPPPPNEDLRKPEPRPDEVIEVAVGALKKIGWRPDETTPVLEDIRALAAELAENENPHAQAAAKEAMKIFGVGEPPPAGPLVRQLVRDEERLRAMGEKAVPILVDALDQDSGVIRLAVQGLGKLGERAAPAVPRLLEIVRDRRWRPGQRAAAMEALGKIGEAARPAIPYLRQLVQLDGISQGEQRLAKAAREALDRIDAPAD